LVDKHRKNELLSQKVVFELAFIPKKFRNEEAKATFCHGLMVRLCKTPTAQSPLPPFPQKGQSDDRNKIR